MPTLTDEIETETANDLQAKLLRYRMVNHQRVCDARIETRDFVPAVRDEGRAWLAPIRDHPDLLQSVTSTLLQHSQQIGEERFVDDTCLAAEAALFFCHKADTEHFFVGDLAERVTALLEGRHEDRAVTDRKAGSLLGELGIRGERITKGYRIRLTDAVRQQIHRIAHDYQVLPAKDGIARCRHCPGTVSE
ncbi:MAG: hypothetical protein ACRD20_14680 [Terriglobales bacterium]